MIRKYSVFLIAAAASCMPAMADITVEQCVELAHDNYPLLRKYDILQQTDKINISDINKSWLPQIGIYAQGTVQNVVPSFPDALNNILEQMNTDVSGLGKTQYKIGVDVNQTIWDGGTSKARRTVARSTSEQQAAAVDVQLYAVRERVENLFFGILLVEEQTKISEQTLALLQNNLAKLKSMESNGTAMQCDVDMVEAQTLAVDQQIIQVKGQTQCYRRLLGIYTGKEMTKEKLVKPKPEMPASMASTRPELDLFAAQAKANNARQNEISSSLMPKIGLFAQAFYGYPGFNNFKSMMDRDLSFNIVAGMKVSWNLGAYYTRKNSLSRIKLANATVETDRDVFLFTNKLRTNEQTARIEELQKVIENDRRISDLRTNVRKAAESQLENGVIDATALLTKITDENQARLTSSIHEIQLIQSIYQLKYTLNQ